MHRSIFHENKHKLYKNVRLLFNTLYIIPSSALFNVDHSFCFTQANIYPKSHVTMKKVVKHFQSAVCLSACLPVCRLHSASYGGGSTTSNNTSRLQHIWNDLKFEPWEWSFDKDWIEIQNKKCRSICVPYIGRYIDKKSHKIFWHF